MSSSSATTSASAWPQTTQCAISYVGLGMRASPCTAECRDWRTRAPDALVSVAVLVPPPPTSTPGDAPRATSSCLLALAIPTCVFAQRDSVAFTGVHWREIGPYRGGRSVAATGNPSRPERILDGHARRRRVQIDQRRPIVGAGDGQVFRRHDRRDCRGGVRAGRRLRRRRGVSDPRQRLARRRRVEDDRRRQDVGVHGTRRHAADRRHRRQSDERRSRLRRRARPRLGAERRARRVPLEGRRQDVGENTLSK